MNGYNSADMPVQISQPLNQDEHGAQPSTQQLNGPLQSPFSQQPAFSLPPMPQQPVMMLSSMMTRQRINTLRSRASQQSITVQSTMSQRLITVQSTILQRPRMSAFAMVSQPLMTSSNTMSQQPVMTLPSTMPSQPVNTRPSITAQQSITVQSTMPRGPSKSAFVLVNKPLMTSPNTVSQRPKTSLFKIPQRRVMLPFTLPVRTTSSYNVPSARRSCIVNSTQSLPTTSRASGNGTLNRSTVQPVNSAGCYCGRGLKSSYLLKCRIRRHTDVRSFKCCVCHKSFVQRSTLNKHMQEKHGNNLQGPNNKNPKVYVCEICGYIAHGHNDLILHQKIKHQNGREPL